eukprot:Nitzschia sp. Nitz4//scaffold32_size149145//87021//89535//NITZ4_002886-RA/size149145-processed-gene-0.128-mRNA-1//-1//CDS//3329548090//6429//frame0
MKTILLQQSFWVIALVASPNFAHGFWGRQQNPPKAGGETSGDSPMSGFAVASGGTTQQASSSGPVEGFSPDPHSTEDLEKLEYYANHDDSKSSMQTQSMTTETHSSVVATHQEYLASSATETPAAPSAGFGPVTSSSSHSSSSTEGFAPDPPSSEELKKIQAKQKGSGTAPSSMSSEAQTPVTHSSLNSTPHDGGNRRLRGGTVTQQRRAVQGCQGERKIVQCLDGVEEEECKAQLVAAGVEVVADMPKTEFFAVCVDSQAEANLVAQLTDVAAIEDDPVRSPSVVAGSEVKRHLQSSQETPYGVNLVKAPEFWSQYGTTGEGKKICIIDSGLRRTHQDLKDIDDLTGATDSDLVTPWYEDGSSHGTHVAGTIAAQSNSVGVVGVAPGVAIHIVRVFDDYGDFSASGLVEAMNDCADADADVITMSLGGAVYNYAEATMASRLANQGILLVAASGNGADYDNAVNYPAAYSSVMSVGALNEDSEIASFSTHNSNVDIAGPGVSVLSTTSDSDYSYAEYDGTSMATPHVSAVAALLWSEFPNKSASQIRTALEKSATDVGACGKDRLFGHGLVNIMAAADYLERGTTAPELSGCTSVAVSLLTDDYGSETTYIITPKGDGDNIVYRGGPYTDGYQATYTDNFQLEEGCYSLTVLDSYGDGFSGSYGGGSLTVTYDGSTEVSYDDFTGSSETFEFGECGGNNNGGGTGSSELEIELYLTTDLWSWSENSLYLYDDDDQDDAFLWYMPRYSFSMYTDYEGWATLDSSRCYKFYFFDSYGDGLSSSGGLTLIENGVTVLEVSGSGSTWYHEFGSC